MNTPSAPQMAPQRPRAAAGAQLTAEDLRRIVRIMGAQAAEDIQWAERVRLPRDALAFAREAIFVIANSGMHNTVAQRIFDKKLWLPEQPLRVTLIGTDFEVRVWETLLRIPMGHAVCYSDIARKIESPKASRAVGAAVGKNPISFVVPCHRALGKSGALTGYHWGITRKQAMIGWEAGQVGLQ